MNPNQPAGSPQHNPYDFITNPGQPPKRSFGSGNDLMKKVMIIVGGAVILMIVAAIVVSLLTSGSQGATQSMKDIVFEQQEIIFLSADGAKEAIDPSIKALAITSQLSVQSDQTKISSYLDKAGSGVDKKLIPTKISTETVAALENAKSSNRYDEVFEELLRSKLSDYQLSLKSAYESTGSEDAKMVLSDAYTSASNLLAPPVASK